MKKSNDESRLSNLEFMKQFEDCVLDPATFNHVAHLRLVWIHIDMFGIEKAQNNIQRQLQKFVKHAGAKDKYHETLTIAAVEAVNHFMDKSKSNNFEDFVVEFPQLKDDFKGLINSHYSFNIFESERAKKEYLEPDVAPFNV